jgi:hypothetical protein
VAKIEFRSCQKFHHRGAKAVGKTQWTMKNGNMRGTRPEELAVPGKYKDWMISECLLYEKKIRILKAVLCVTFSLRTKLYWISGKKINF